MKKHLIIIVFSALLFMSAQVNADITIKNDSDYTISYGLIQGYQYTSGGSGTNVILRGYWPRLRPGASYTYNKSDYAGSSSFIFSYIQIAPDNKITTKLPSDVKRDSRIVKNVRRGNFSLPSRMPQGIRTSNNRNHYLSIYTTDAAGIASISREVMAGGRTYENIPSVTFEIPDPTGKRNLQMIVTNEDLHLYANTFN